MKKLHNGIHSFAHSFLPDLHHLPSSSIARNMLFFLGLFGFGTMFFAQVSANAGTTINTSLNNNVMTVEKLRVTDTGLPSGVRKVELSNGGLKLNFGASTGVLKTDNNDYVVQGLVQGADIQDYTIDGTKIQNNAITNTKIASGTITDEKIQDGAITCAKLNIPGFSCSATTVPNDACNPGEFLQGISTTGGFICAPGNGGSGSGGSLPTCAEGQVIKFISGSWTCTTPTISSDGGSYWAEDPDNYQNIHNTNAGNVGVGISAPTQTLTVSGSMLVLGNGAIENTSTSTPTASSVCASLSPYRSYSSSGSILFNSIPVTYTATPTATYTSNYWMNNPMGYANGPLNRAGVWKDTDCNGTADIPPQQAGAYSGGNISLTKYFVNTGSTRTIYIGVNGDNDFKFVWNGQVVVDTQTQPPIGIGPHRYWFIAPITLNAGINTLSMMVTDYGFAAVAGATLYDNTSAQLAAATKDSDLNILWTSSQQNLFTSYECPTGETLDIAAGTNNFVCVGTATATNGDPNSILYVKNGKVGILTSTPQYTLDVVGTVRALQVITTSDARLKTNIKVIDNALQSLLGINGYSYTLKSDGSKQYGVLAQEVEQFFPYLVSTDASGYKAVNYNGLIAPIIQSIHDIDTKVQSIQAKYESNEDRINALEKKISK